MWLQGFPLCCSWCHSEVTADWFQDELNGLWWQITVLVLWTNFHLETNYRKMMNGLKRSIYSVFSSPHWWLKSLYTHSSHSPVYVQYTVYCTFCLTLHTFTDKWHIRGNFGFSMLPTSTRGLVKQKIKPPIFWLYLLSHSRITVTLKTGFWSCVLNIFIMPSAETWNMRSP